MSALEGGYRIQGGIVSAFARSVAAHVRALSESHEQRWDPADAQVLPGVPGSYRTWCSAGFTPDTSRIPLAAPNAQSVYDHDIRFTSKHALQACPAVTYLCPHEPRRSVQLSGSARRLRLHVALQPIPWHLWLKRCYLTLHAQQVEREKEKQRLQLLQARQLAAQAEAAATAARAAAAALGDLDGAQADGEQADFPAAELAEMEPVPDRKRRRSAPLHAPDRL